MNLEVVGRHALLFDDDANAAFVNSEGALVEWNSLLIDRYDVRHLLSGPPPSRRRRNLQQSQSASSSAESELDSERYLDLPPPSEEQESDEGTNPVYAGVYNAVGFSYGNTDASNDQKSAESGLECPAFHPPFPVPENLLQSLPPTEKMHQIIARTAMFVSKHGGQSEIVLRVKQGKNPAFGFLMPDDDLHPYFRFLVDHQELLQSEGDGKSQYEERNSDAKQSDGGGALSLLGSFYGYGEDEDGAIENASVSKENMSGEPLDASAPISHGSEKTESPVSTILKDEALSKHILSKEKATKSRKSSKAGSSRSTKRDEESSVLLSDGADKLKTSSLHSISKSEPLIFEPPSDLKRLVEKIVEFIIKNGKQFEAVLVEQDSGHGRFPFLLPTNQYHPYYLKVLQKAQESKLTAKSFLSEKDGHGPENRTTMSKETDALSHGSVGYDMPYDSDRKEKFKMVLGKSKKDGPEPPSKTTQQQFGVGVDAAAAAAILQAATRGIRNPNFGFLSSTSLNGNSQGRSSDGGLSAQPERIIQKSAENVERTVSAPVAKAIAKTVALEAASEADSSEAHLTTEQKLKAERLKRAKMFVAMLKTGAPPPKTDSSLGLSVEPQESRFSRSADEVNLVAKEREGSSAPLDVDPSDKNVKSEKKNFDDEYERRSKRKYRSRSSKHEEDDGDGGGGDDDDEKVEPKHSRKKHRSHRSSHDGESEEEQKEERANKRSRKKYRLHRSSHEGNEQEDEDEDEEGREDNYLRKKCQSHRSSPEEIDHEDGDDKYSRKKRRSHQSSHEEIDDEDEEERDDKYSRKKHRSHQSSYEEIDEEDDSEEERDDKYSRKKHRSHRSSREEIEVEEESDDKYLRKKSRSHRSSREEIGNEEEERDEKHSHKKHRSRHSSRHGKDGHKKRRDRSKERESRHKVKRDISSNEVEQGHIRNHNRSEKHKGSQLEREELEEGEISSKISDQSRGSAGVGGASREVSVDLSSSYQDKTAPSQPSEITEVSDDLRAKIRAMLMATM
ncbi:hypothetical protein LguiA_023321 [Lonicera macranthoides]